MNKTWSRWTPERLEYLTTNWPDLSISSATMGVQLGISGSAVRRKAASLGLQPRPERQRDAFMRAHATPAPALLREMLIEVAKLHEVEPADIRFNHSRARWISWPRQEFMWRARQVKREDGRHRYSFQSIASYLGGLDHTSAIQGAQAHEKRALLESAHKPLLIDLGSRLPVVKSTSRIAA